MQVRAEKRALIAPFSSGRHATNQELRLAECISIDTLNPADYDKIKYSKKTQLVFQCSPMHTYSTLKIMFAVLLFVTSPHCLFLYTLRPDQLSTVALCLWV